MWNRSLLALSTFLIASLMYPSGGFAAQIKNGSSCTKLHQISKVQGVSFQCVKAGNKLKWKIVNPKISTSPSGVSDPFSKYGNEAARFRALELYGATLVAARKNNPGEIRTDLQTPNDPLVKRMTENALFAWSVYEGMATLGFTPRWIVGEQGDWIKDQLKDCPNMASWLNPNQGGASCRMVAVWRGNTNNSIMYNTMLIQGGHEIFHLYQQELWGQRWADVPDWVREGGANVGMSIISTHFDGKKTFPDYGAAAAAEKSSRDRGNCAAALDKWESNQKSEGFGFNNGCEYGLGSIMNEFLVMKGFTLKDHLSLIKTIGLGTDFPLAFEQVYKMSTAQYFTELRAYLKTLNYGW